MQVEHVGGCVGQRRLDLPPGSPRLDQVPANSLEVEVESGQARDGAYRLAGDAVEGRKAEEPGIQVWLGLEAGSEDGFGRQVAEDSAAPRPLVDEESPHRPAHRPGPPARRACVAPTRRSAPHCRG